MAIYNGIQERSLIRVLQQRLTMLGDAPAPALVPEISASLVLETDRPEWGRWKGELPFSISFNQAAVAAEYSSVWLTPPVGRVIVVQRIEVFTPNAIGFGWRTTQPTYTAPAIQNAYWRDNSTGSVPAGIGGILGTSVAVPAYDNANAAALGRLNATLNNAWTDGPIILWPGGAGLLFRDQVANQSVQFVLTGYSRPLLPNELG